MTVIIKKQGYDYSRIFIKCSVDSELVTNGDGFPVMRTTFNKIDYKVKVMGLECTKGTQRPREWYDRLKVDDLESELRNIKEVTTFSIKINDLRFLNFCQVASFLALDF